MEKRKKAYIIYLQAVEQYEHLQEKEKKRLQRIYIKSCYGVCRCGLGLIAKRSSLLNELILLFDFQPKEQGITPFEMKKFSEINPATVNQFSFETAASFFTINAIRSFRKPQSLTRALL